MQAQLPAGVTQIKCVRESCRKVFAVLLHTSQLPPAVPQPSRRQPVAPRKLARGLQIYNEYVKSSLPAMRREQPHLTQPQRVQLLAQRWPASEMNPINRRGSGDAAGQQRSAAADDSAPDEGLGGGGGPAATAAARGARGLDADPAAPAGRGGNLDGVENRGAGGAAAEQEAVREGAPSPQRGAESSDDDGELSLELQGAGPRKLSFASIHAAAPGRGAVAAARRDASRCAAMMPTARATAGSSSSTCRAAAPANTAAGGKAPRKVPHCRRCGVPRKGHVCPGAAAPAAASGAPANAQGELEELEAGGDALAGLILHAQRRDARNEEMRGRVAGEVDVMMVNGVNPDPRLGWDGSAMYRQDSHL